MAVKQTAGRGWYQERGKQARELHPGNVVNIPPEVKHWHGAGQPVLQPGGGGPR